MNKQYGYWTVLSIGVPYANGSARYNCQCKCGLQKLVGKRNLVDGNSTKCRLCAAAGKRNRIPKPNDYKVLGAVTKIFVKDRVCLVDSEDYDIVKKYHWGVTLAGYIKTYYQGQLILIHQLILPNVKVHTDHINRIRSDNRKSNLRPASFSENMSNTGPKSTTSTGLKGVSWHKTSGYFQAKITKDYKQHWLGYYDDPILAAEAYDAAAIRLHGEFAMTNKMLGLL